MSMKGGAGAAKSKAQDKSWRQLRGVVGEWRSGRHLMGRSGQLTFDLPYANDAHIILLSLLEPDQLPLLIRDDIAEDLNVALAASMPQHLLERLVWRHGSSRDLVELLIAARNRERRLEGAQAVEALDSLHAFAYSHSPFGRQRLNRTDPLSQALVQLVDVWRLQSPASTVATASPLALDPASTMDDLGWKGFFDILGTLHDPATPRLLRLPDESVDQIQNGTLALATTMRRAGAEEVIVSTYPPPPPGIVPWPPDYLDAVEVRTQDHHTMVLGRTARLHDKHFHRRWAEAWQAARALPDTDVPPVGVVLHLSSIGIGSIFCGSRGHRPSATHSYLTRALAKPADQGSN